ncbi:MAG: hypothetical protein M1829_002651 [Trizodia sp. TS-e1964]|nr:MAG: hypothetical protein M1829_002651 [Trizodia sp. TS-e1964]
MPTAPPKGMFTLESRLASFSIAYPSKGRRSSAKSKASKKLVWPHTFLSPLKLAEAGFYFQPTQSNPDNVCCFLCERNFDGWEEQDEPLREHLQHSRNCGWAICVSIKESIANGNKKQLAYPLDDAMTEARRATFAESWPHSGKKDWLCSIDKMVEAGWYYCPIPESDDSVTCAYCDLGLDGWELGDDPAAEHRSRSKSCLYFQLIDKATKAVKGKKGRASKASRVSSQSIPADMSEAHSYLSDLTSGIGDSILSVTAPTKPPNGRKVSKGKSANPTRSTRQTRANREDTADLITAEEQNAESLSVELQPPTKPSKGRKRKSDDAELDTNNIAKASDTANVSIEIHVPKKRLTRASFSQSAIMESQISTDNHDEDISMADLGTILMPKRATGRKRSASLKPKARKASKATVKQQIPDDDEIDRMLQADLDRPLTDDEAKEEPAAFAVEIEIAQGKPLAGGGVASRTGNSVLSTGESSAAPGPSMPAQAVVQQLTPQQDVILTQPIKEKKTASKAGKPVKAKAAPKVRKVVIETLSAAKRITPSPSPQASDAENQPPSSRTLLPSFPTTTTRVPLAPSTPTAKIMNRLAPNPTGSPAWKRVDVQTAFLKSPSVQNKENSENLLDQAILRGGELSSAEKKMSVEEWFRYNAQSAEDKLRAECERMVSVFESQGGKAMRMLEAMEAVE